MKLSVRSFLLLVLALVLACSVVGLLPRLRLERQNKDVSIIVDYRDLPPLAEGAGLGMVETIEYLKDKGVGGLMVGEFTGDDILNGLAPLTMSPSLSKNSMSAVESNGTLFFIPASFRYASQLTAILARKAGSVPFSVPQGTAVEWRVPMDALRKNSVIPDLEGLNAAVAANVPVFYRIAPAQPWQIKESLAATKNIIETYRNISLISPSGEVVIGYPDLRPMADLLKSRQIPLAMIEFSRQVGSSQLNWTAFPNLIQLHSVTNEELMLRNINRRALHERLIRAAVERSVRLLLLRPPVSGNVESALASFGNEIEFLAHDLTAHGLKVAWPHSVFIEKGIAAAPWYSALACAAVLLLSMTRYLKRLVNFKGRFIELGEGVFFVLFTCILALMMMKLAFIGRLAGALAAVFITTEVSLIAMDDSDRHWRQLGGAFIFAIIGGLAIAAFFSNSYYMLRLRSFSGVKVTLMLPPVLMLFHDMRRRIHPESLRCFLSRAPLWGELCLALVLCVLLALVLFRSDNVRFISGFEVRLRDSLERFLIARPRNKEIFIGYPSLLLYVFAVNMDLWAHYRELLRIGVALGFSSVINSFCHFHTPLLFILLREFNGLWVGVVIGVAVLIFVRFVVLPIWRRSRFLTE